MINFVPFGESKKAQDIITEYINKPYEKPSAINPNYDLREPGQEFPPLNPPVQTTPVVDDPCPPGYQLIDGVCQPIEQFSPETNYADQNDDGKSFEEERAEERPYFDIEGMAELSDDELIDYLKQGYLSNSALGFLPSKGSLVSVKGTPPSQLGFALGLLGLNDSAMREQAMNNELRKRGLFSGQFNESGDPLYDLNQTPIENPLFVTPATTNEADVSYGGNTPVGDAGGSYGGGEDFGGGNYQGNVVMNNQQIQQETDRINQVVKDIESGRRTVFGGL